MPKRLLLPLDLQLFSADGGEFGGYDPASAYDGIDTAPAEPQVQPEGQGEPFQQPQEPQVLDFGGRKLQANEELMGLHKDFTETQRYITALQGQVNALQQAQQAQQFQQQPQAPQQQEITSNVQEWNEETWQEFYDKPQEIFDRLLDQKLQTFVQQNLDPILQERQWNNEIQTMYDKFPDFDQYVGDIQNLVEQFPEYASPGGLENAYYRAVATNGGRMNPAQLAQDPQFLNQYVLSNPQVQQQVVGNYMQQKQQTNAQLPNAMGRGAGGFTPQSPDASPTTLREASRAFMKNLGMR